MIRLISTSVVRPHEELLWIPFPGYSIEALEVEPVLFEDGDVAFLLNQMDSRVSGQVVRDIWCDTVEELLYQACICHGMPVDAWQLEPGLQKGRLIDLLPALIEARSPAHVSFVRSALAAALLPMPTGK